MLVLTNIGNNKFCEAFSYHNEPFKTAVTVKEIINLKYEIDIKKKFHKKQRKVLSRAYEFLLIKQNAKWES